MLARYLRAFLLLELVAYVAAATLAGARGTLGTTLAVIAAIALSLRVAPVLTGFAIAWFNRAERPAAARIGLLGTLRLIGLELLTVFALYTLLLPFERRFTIGGWGEQDAVPVLLIHGFFENSGLWWPLARGLRGCGFEFHTLNVEPPFGSIDGYVAGIAERVEQLSATSPTRRVLLVAHSMGGLAARAYLQHDPRAANRIAGVVTLGAPHRGTVLARLADLANVRQMRPDSEWLARLNAAPPPAGVPMAAIYTWHDNIVAPQDSATLESARNLAVSGIGHQALVLSPLVRGLVHDFLASVVSEGAGGGAHSETGPPA